MSFFFILFSFLFRQFSWRIFAIICFRFVVVSLLLCTRVGNLNTNANASVNTRMNTSSNTSFECWVSVTILALVVRPGNTQPKQPAVRAANQARLGLAWIKNNTDRRQATLTGDRRQTADDRRLRDAETQRRAWSVEAAAAPAELNYPTRCRYEKQLIARPRSTNWTELNWTELSNAATTSSVERRRRWERSASERERETQ